MSAAQGLGTGDLLDRIVELAPTSEERTTARPRSRVRLAVIGRPNVGKSSLVNRFAGAERVIVSPVAGTTRDAIDLPIEFEGRSLILVDTAGLRRQAKVGESIEYYTSLRSRRAAERADVALVVCDATDGITAQDLRVAELAMRSGCATALVLNKWDIADEVDLDYERARAQQKLRLRPRVLTASAKTGRNIERLLVEAVALADRRAARIPTPQLNRFLSDVVAARQPPAGGPQHSGHRLKLLFMTQTDERPPRFSIQVNSRARVTRDYAYFIENRLRERYRLEGVPVIIDFVERNERRARRRRRCRRLERSAAFASFGHREGCRGHSANTGRQVAQRAPGNASVNVPMSSVTRPRAPVPTVPERRERRTLPRPGGGRDP